MELKATRYDVDGPLATVTLARPHRLNAWTGRMHTEYRWCIAEAESDPAVRAIIVTGEGRGFCAGADSAALEGHVEKGGYDSGIREPLANPGYGVRPEFDHNFAFQFGLTKPVIAAINGPAAGVGLVIGCFADIRFAAAGIKLTTAHGKLGLPAEYGLSWLLPRLVGVSRASELLFSSRVFLAEEAAAMGLLTGVLPGDELMPFVRDYARRLAATVAPSSLRETKRQLYADLHRDVGSAVAESEVLLDQMTKSADFREGVAALLEKREPRFPGH
ncbi:MAG: enoyl-CoA hydratase/isomerase family protein [Chloroflexi bacterium]|nr:enoyl-CoA hydratase/isomerase family protein [Chloroflexota bacterium]